MVQNDLRAFFNKLFCSVSGNICSLNTAGSRSGKRSSSMKMKDGSNPEVSSTPCVNGDMPRPCHHPVKSSQCANENQKQRRQQCPRMLFSPDSECESSLVPSKVNSQTLKFVKVALLRMCLALMYIFI